MAKVYSDIFHMSLVSMGCNYLYTKFLSQGRIQLSIQVQLVTQVGHLHFCLLNYIWEISHKKRPYLLYSTYPSLGLAKECRTCYNRSNTHKREKIIRGSSYLRTNSL